MRKKGYVFTLDATIAILILLIGFTVLYYQFAVDSKTTYFTDRLSEEVIGVMAHTKVSDLCVVTKDTCDCPNYQTLTNLSCAPRLRADDPTILEMLTEIIETGTHPGNEVEDMIHEIFVTGKVIDEKRFGFSVLYTNLGLVPVPLELYNTETYSRP